MTICSGIHFDDIRQGKNAFLAVFRYAQAVIPGFYYELRFTKQETGMFIFRQKLSVSEYIKNYEKCLLTGDDRPPVHSYVEYDSNSFEISDIPIAFLSSIPTSLSMPTRLLGGYPRPIDPLHHLRFNKNEADLFEYNFTQFIDSISEETVSDIYLYTLHREGLNYEGPFILMRTK